MVSLTSCEDLKRQLVDLFTPQYKVEAVEAELTGPDANRKRILIKLQPVAKEFVQITDIQFPPTGKYGVVLEKTGGLHWFSASNGSKGLIHKFEVATASEEGLLGAAFHPNFGQNQKIYLNYVIKRGSKDFSQVVEYKLTSADLSVAKIDIKTQRVIMEVAQPYQNHNAGQLVFGPDGYLYIGWGDGGWRNDPLENGQNPNTWLGSMLRIDINKTEGGKQYGIPSDNPFVGSTKALPETFAYGLRNPWRYTFDQSGRLIVADVGQDEYEEVSIVEKGKNYGWNTREAFHCFDPKTNCPTKDLVDPIWEYSHTDGGLSITGGYVYLGSVKELKGKYLFADFVNGKMWALDLPADSTQRVKDVYTLGKWPILIASFGRDSSGEVYVADHAGGTVYLITD